MTDRPAHLNQVQLARRWHLSPRTLERWRSQGEGRAFLKLGGRVVYRLSDIEAFETQSARTTSPQSPSANRSIA
jgi:hypothetical protein